MTEFKINAENVKRLSTLSGQSKDLISLTKSIFCPSDGNLSVSLYSNRVTMSFSVDITGFSSDDTEELNFFSMPIEEFNTTLATVSKDENDVQIVVDKAHNKVTFKNETTGTKVSRSVYNATVTIDEAKASITAVDDMREKYLTDPVTLKVTNEVSTFIETIGKIMGLLKSQDAVSLNGTVAKYADQLVVISKTLTNPVSDTEVHLKKQLYDAIKPFLKITDELTVYLTKDFSIAFFESKDLGFKSVLNLEKPRYAFPEDTDLKMALPTEERQVVVKTSKAALKDAFVPFNNTFKATPESWNWKKTDLDSSPENLADGKWVLSYANYTGSAESVVPVTVLNNTEGGENGKLIVSIMVLEELLSIIPEDELTITYNSLPSDTMNGALMKIETETVNACVTKYKP